MNEYNLVIKSDKDNISQNENIPRAKESAKASTMENAYIQITELLKSTLKSNIEKFSKIDHFIQKS